MYQIKIKQKDIAHKYIIETSSIYFIAVLLGQSEGRIWTDNRENPSFLLVWSAYMKGFQLMGKPLEEKQFDAFRRWFQRELIPFLQTHEIKELEYGADTEELHRMMSEIFHDCEIGCEKQKFFSHNKRKQPVEELVDYQILKIDERFLRDTLLNMNYVVDEIMDSYQSIEAYLKRGYGFVAVQNGAIAARAVMTFGYEGKSNISVATLMKHRKKGLSSCLTACVINEALDRGQIPIWDCSEDNMASEKTALHNGFVQIREDKVCFMQIAGEEEKWNLK